MLSKLFGSDDRAKQHAAATRQLRMLAGQSGRSADAIGAMAGVPGNSVSKLLDPATLTMPVEFLAAITPHVVGAYTALDLKTLTFVTVATNQSPPVPANSSLGGLPKKDKKMRILATLVKPVSFDAMVPQQVLADATDATALSALSLSVSRHDERMEFTPAPGEPGVVRTLDAAAYWRLLLRKIEDNADSAVAVAALADKYPATALGQSFLAAASAGVSRLVPFHANSTRSGRWLAGHMDLVALWLMRTTAADNGASALSNELVAPAYDSVAGAMQRRHILTVPASEAALVVTARCHISA